MGRKKEIYWDVRLVLSWRPSIGLRSGPLGGHMSVALNSRVSQRSSSNVWHAWWATDIDILSCWKTLPFHQYCSGWLAVTPSAVCLNSSHCWVDFCTRLHKKAVCGQYWEMSTNMYHRVAECSVDMQKMAGTDVTPSHWQKRTLDHSACSWGSVKIFSSVKKMKLT